MSFLDSFIKKNKRKIRINKILKMKMLRGHIWLCYVLQLDLLCLTIYIIAESIFVDKPRCYRNALSQKMIYFVNSSYYQDANITYKQVTCYSRPGNNFCNNFEENHIESCITSNGYEFPNNVNQPNNTFFIRCRLDTKTSPYDSHVMKAKAFRNNKSIAESEKKIVDKSSSCYCNWTSISPEISFAPIVESPVTEKIEVKLGFKSIYAFNLKITIYLIATSIKKQVCQKETEQYISGNKIIKCILDNLVECKNYKLNIKIHCETCHNETYNFNKTLPMQYRRDLKMRTNDFTCKQHGDEMVPVPVLIEQDYKYLRKNPNKVVEEGFRRKTQKNLRKKYNKFVKIEMCKINCSCRQYVTSKSCNNRQKKTKVSKSMLVVILVSIIVIFVLATVASFIFKKRRQERLEASREILDDPTLPMVDNST